MKLSNQAGFSILHVLPVIAIMAIIGLIGVRLMKPSSASTGISCSSYFPYSEIGRTTTRNASVHFRNSSGRTVAKATANARITSFGKYYFGSTRYSVASGTAPTLSVPVSYPGRAGTFAVEFYAAYNFSGSSSATVSCGTKYVKFL